MKWEQMTDEEKAKVAEQTRRALKALSPLEEEALKKRFGIVDKEDDNAD